MAASPASTKTAHQNAGRRGEIGRATSALPVSSTRPLVIAPFTTGPSVLTGGRPARGGADGTGRGLLGLRQRVAVFGGDLDARRRLGGGYRVRARIPVDTP